MKVLKIDLPKELKSVEIHTLADLHIGDKFCDIKGIKEKIEYIKNTPNAYCILNGDLMNNATKTSVSDCYAEELTPMEQVEMCVELLGPIAKKVLCCCGGNHEKRTYIKEGIDISKLVAMQLGFGDRYSPTSCFIFLRVGTETKHAKNRQVCYMIYCLHGSGSGGKKEGAKANRLAEMASKVDADIFIHSHLHFPITFRKAFHRTSPQNSSVAKVDKLFVNTAAALDYGGYGEDGEFDPSSKENPVIHLSGTEKRFDATL